MHHERIAIDTGNARQAAETAARLQAVAGNEGVRIHAEGDLLRIDFSNPGLADLIHVACRMVAGLANGVAGLIRRGEHGEPALPSRP